MKKIIVFLIISSFMLSCQQTNTVKGICEGAASDLTGFVGKYKFSLMGAVLNAEIIKESQIGTYRLVFESEGEEGDLEAMPLRTCLINGEVYADGFSSESNSYAAMSITDTEDIITIDSLRLDVKLLDSMGIKFSQEENDEFPISVLTVDNTNISNSKLLKSISSDDDLEVFSIVLFK